MAQSGQLKNRVTEEQLIDLLNQVKSLSCSHPTTYNLPFFFKSADGTGWRENNSTEINDCGKFLLPST